MRLAVEGINSYTNTKILLSRVGLFYNLFLLKKETLLFVWELANWGSHCHSGIQIIILKIIAFQMCVNQECIYQILLEKLK